MSVPQYPVCLTLEGRPVLVVGGGPIAARKVSSLLHCGASVTVVTKALCPSMERHAGRAGVKVKRRPFRASDVEGMALVIAATNDGAVNRAVFGAAREARALVNVVDQPELCEFTAPAVIRRGLLAVTVSTSGASPALAGRLRKELEAVIAPEWATVTRALAAFRRKLMTLFPDRPDARRKIFKAASALDLTGLVRQGGRAALDAELRALADQGGGRGR